MPEAFSPARWKRPATLLAVFGFSAILALNLSDRALRPGASHGWQLESYSSDKWNVAGLTIDALVAFSLTLSAVAMARLARHLLFGRRGSRLLSLLLLMGCLSVGLAWFRSAQDRQFAEEAAARELSAMGIGVAWQPARPAWFWNGLAMASGRQFRHAIVASPELKTDWTHSDEVQFVEERALELLGRLPHLREIELSRAEYNGGPFVTPRVDNESLAGLAGLSGLRRLSIAGQDLTDGALESLAGLANLEHLDVSRSGLTQSAIEVLRERHPHARIIGP